MEKHFPNNIKRGDVCAYVEVSLPVHNFNNSYLSECLTLEVTISNKKGYVITLTLLPLGFFGVRILGRKCHPLYNSRTKYGNLMNLCRPII